MRSVLHLAFFNSHPPILTLNAFQVMAQSEVFEEEDHMDEPVAASSNEVSASCNIHFLPYYACSKCLQVMAQAEVFDEEDHVTESVVEPVDEPVAHSEVNSPFSSYFLLYLLTCLVISQVVAQSEVLEEEDHVAQTEAKSVDVPHQDIPEETQINITDDSSDISKGTPESNDSHQPEEGCTEDQHQLESEERASPVDCVEEEKDEV